MRLVLWLSGMEVLFRMNRFGLVICFIYNIGFGFDWCRRGPGYRIGVYFFCVHMIEMIVLSMARDDFP